MKEEPKDFPKPQPVADYKVENSVKWGVIAQTFIILLASTSLAIIGYFGTRMVEADDEQTIILRDINEKFGEVNTIMHGFNIRLNNHEKRLDTHEGEIHDIQSQLYRREE